MDKILIITHSADNESVDRVISFIQEAGGQAIRFNVNQYPLSARLTTSFDGESWKSYLENEEGQFRIDDITAFWYRRAFNIGKGLKESLDTTFFGAVMGEVRATIFGFMESVSCYALGKPSVYRRLDSKEEQLKVAHNIGFNVPKNCITNNPDRARQFITDLGKDAICKMQSSFAIYEEGAENVVFTNIVNQDNMDTIDDLVYCPMQFQEKLEKQKELRVTVVGRQVFAFEIDSQQYNDAKVDWRKDGINILEKWEPVDLPEDITSKIAKLMDYYKIDYGALDLILTPENQYYFIEINVAGEFFWLDRLTENHAISKAIADLLLTTGGKRDI